MPAKIVLGDLLECDAQYIAHQSNCVSRLSNHLAKSIFGRFRYADIYAERARGNYIHIPGELYIRGNGEDQRYVINLMGQVLPGGPGTGNIGRLQIVDDAKTRLRLFSACLDKIAQIKKLKSVAFPWKIGCGAAKGNWEDYKALIDELADLIGDPYRPHPADVMIIKRPQDE